MRFIQKVYPKLLLCFFSFFFLFRKLIHLKFANFAQHFMKIFQIANLYSVKHSIYRVCGIYIYDNLIYDINFVEFDKINFLLFMFRSF